MWIHPFEIKKDEKVGKRKRLRLANPGAAIQILFGGIRRLSCEWQPRPMQFATGFRHQSLRRSRTSMFSTSSGLAYLTGGASTVLSGYANGKLMDWNYRATTKEAGLSIDRISGNDLTHFPIERARSRGSWYLLAI